MLDGLERKTNFPIFAAAAYKNKIFVAGGGGGQTYGVCNYITAIDAVTLSETFKMDTGGDLIEKVYVNEIDDILIAISEPRALIYRITDKGMLIQSSSIELDYDENLKTHTAYYENRLAIGIGKRLSIYEIKDSKFNKLFDLNLDNPIDHLINTGNPNNFFVALGGKIKVLSVRNSRFIGEVDLDTRRKGLFILYNKKHSIYFMITSSQTESKVHIYEKMSDTLSKFKLIEQHVIGKSRITAVNGIDEVITIGDINGKLEVVKYVSPKIIKLLSRQIHDLPPNNIILKHMPSTAKDSSLLVLTFGADYKIRVTQIECALLEKTHQSSKSDWLYMLVFLLLAIFIGMMYLKADK